ncbi:MAG: hypothetical protein Q8Q12_09885 [bacterium]|nr:hypothetical protein [bacterium]
MKINCLSCGHKVDLDHVYDDYAGQVKCFACGALLEIRTEGGHLKSVGLARFSSRLSPEEALERAAR